MTTYRYAYKIFYSKNLSLGNIKFCLKYFPEHEDETVFWIIFFKAR